MTADRAFIFAKACGIIGKSFVGPNLAKLKAVSSLEDLQKLVIADAPEGAAGTQDSLLGDSGSRQIDVMALEAAIRQRAMRHILNVVGHYDKNPPIVAHLVQAVEYAELKNCINAIHENEKTPPAHTNIGRYASMHFDAYPDLEQMLIGNKVFFTVQNPDKSFPKMGQDFDAEKLCADIDVYYYTRLWKILVKTRRSDCRVIHRIENDEIIYKNIAWALRLRKYYNYSGVDIDKRLIHINIKSQDSSVRDMAAPAQATYAYRLDDRGDWNKWRYQNMLNPETSGAFWRCDPRYFQNAASMKLYLNTWRHFPFSPFSLDTACCYIRLKQFEMQVLNGIAEGLRLGLTASDVFSTLGFDAAVNIGVKNGGGTA
jgi:hypothetical protein